MGEDLKSRMAAINAAKAERAKKQEDEARLSVEIGRGQEDAGEENKLRDRAKELEIRVVEAEQTANEAEETIRQAQSMLTEGGLEPEDQALIEDGIKEEQQKVEELNAVKAELVGVRAQIEALNTKPEAVAELLEEAGEDVAKKVNTSAEDERPAKVVEVEKTQEQLLAEINDYLKPIIEETRVLLETDFDKLEGSLGKINELKDARAELSAKCLKFAEGASKNKDYDKAKTVLNQLVYKVMGRINKVIDRIAAKINHPKDERQNSKGEPQAVYSTNEVSQLLQVSDMLSEIGIKTGRMEDNEERQADLGVAVLKDIVDRTGMRSHLDDGGQRIIEEKINKLGTDYLGRHGYSGGDIKSLKKFFYDRPSLLTSEIGKNIDSILRVTEQK